MSDGHTVQGTPIRGRSGDRWVAALVVVLLVAFVGVAIAKPWGAVPARPVSTAAPSGTNRADPPASIRPTGPLAPGDVMAALAGPLPVAFTTPAPPAASATWTGLRWRRLAPDDPRSLVTSVLSWKRGYVAVGLVDHVPATPVWLSADGRRWDPLPFDTSTTFWPGLAVIGVAELPTGLVALTETVQFCGTPCTSRYELPVVSWTSADGRQWTPHVLPPEWLSRPAGSPPLFAAGPAGLIVASSGMASRIATSSDGSHWRLLPARGFPAQFGLNDIRGTKHGYVAAGRWVTSKERWDAASLWSADGRHWSQVPTLLPASHDPATDVPSAVATLVGGRDGLIAIGRGVTSPGTALWWQSADGRTWRSLTGYPPLGALPRGGTVEPTRPRGALVGDGVRLVAVRGGPDAAGWVSRDGQAWRQVTMSGDLPGEGATQAALLPDGVLLSDGDTTWFGEAIVR